MKMQNMTFLIYVIHNAVIYINSVEIIEIIIPYKNFYLIPKFMRLAKMLSM